MKACREGRDPWPLVAIGGIGTGKTCAGLCLCDAVGGSAIFKTLPQVCSEVIEAGRGDLFSSGARVTASSWWANWTDSPLCVMDEFGSEVKVSGFKYDTAKECIDRREGKPFMLLSNIGIDRLAEIYDERIADRLAAGTVVKLDGESRRTGI